MKLNRVITQGRVKIALFLLPLLLYLIPVGVHSTVSTYTNRTKTANMESLATGKTGSIYAVNIRDALGSLWDITLKYTEFLDSLSSYGLTSHTVISGITTTANNALPKSAFLDSIIHYGIASISTITNISNTANSALPKSAAGDSADAAIARNSTISGIQSTANAALPKASAGDSADAAIARNTTHMLKSAMKDTLNGYGLTSPSYISGLASLAAAALPKVNFGDSLTAGITYKGLATKTNVSDSLALAVLKAAVKDSITAWMNLYLSTMDSSKFGVKKLSYGNLADYANMVVSSITSNTFILSGALTKPCPPLEQAKVDTSLAATDSLTMHPRHVNANGAEYREYWSFNRATTAANKDTLNMYLTWNSPMTNLDSLYCWIRQTDSTGVNCKITITITNSAGTTILSAWTPTNNAENTWGRFSIPKTNDMTLTDFNIVQFAIIVSGSNSIDISRIYAKNI